MTSVTINMVLSDDVELDIYAVCLQSLAARRREIRKNNRFREVGKASALWAGYGDRAQEREGGSASLTDDKPAEAEPEQTAGETEEQKQKRKRRTKAEMEAARAAGSCGPVVRQEIDRDGATVSVETASEDPFPPSEDLNASAKIEAKDFKARFLAYQADNPDHDESKFMRFELKKVVEKIGMDGAQKLMSDLGFANVSVVKVDADREKFLAAIDAALWEG